MSSFASIKPFVSTRNPCRVCAPLGAALAFSGVEGAIPLLHGSQGCSTYIRRYLIGHFREPMDIASSNFHEEAAVFGGKDNLHTALANLVKQYAPGLIGVATTCLAETIGDDVGALLDEFRRERASGDIPVLVPVSTPSYRGSHTDGFFATLLALVKSLSEGGSRENSVNLLPGMVSPADLRYLKELLSDMQQPCTLLADYSDRLDGPIWHQYHLIPPGGTPIEEIRRMGRASATIEFCTSLGSEKTAGGHLAACHNVPCSQMPLPIGVRLSDHFVGLLERFCGCRLPAKHEAERGRLLDALIDGHKYVSEKRVILYGDEELVVSLAAFCAEVGILPVLCVTGGTSGRFKRALEQGCGKLPVPSHIREDTDFLELEELAHSAKADLLIGNSNGMKLSRSLDIPLVRVGLPVHDRFGAARIGMIGYRGTHQLYGRIVNMLIEREQNTSPVGYAHM